MDTEGCLQQVIHLLGHFHIEARVDTGEHNILLGFSHSRLQLSLARGFFTSKLHSITVMCFTGCAVFRSKGKPVCRPAMHTALQCSSRRQEGVSVWL